MKGILRITREEILQTAKPILFNTEMVQAIQNGTKTVTRQVVRNNPEECTSKIVNGVCKICDDKGGFYLPDDYVKARSPYQVGDILYVRETWAYRYCWECEQQGVVEECELESQKFKNAPFGECGCYKFQDEGDEPVDHQWHSAASMPKEAVRIFLRVTGVRVERLRNITIEDSIKEGCLGIPCDCTDKFIAGGAMCCVDCMNTGWKEHPTAEFMELWDSTIKKSYLDKYGWKANPYVWVIEFEKIKE